MKTLKVPFLFLFLLITINVNSQVGVGTTTPQSTLDIEASDSANPSNTDGILIPRVSNFPSTNPTAAQDGMLIFYTGSSGSGKGIYYWDNALTIWTKLTGIEKINDLIDGKSDIDGTNDGSSIFLGIDTGQNDDGSDNQNVGIGFESLQTNTTGYANVAIGYQSMEDNTTGFDNVAVGRGSLNSNTTGYNNIAIGQNAAFSNTTGFRNVAIGKLSLNVNTTGEDNLAIGTAALSSNTLGDRNVAIGTENMRFNTTGSRNTAIGRYSLFNNTTGNENQAIGNQSLNANTTGYRNIAIGYQSLQTNTTGYNNISIGFRTMDNNTTGRTNTAVGYQALYDNTTGIENIALGANSLNNNEDGDRNVAIGFNALAFNESGLNNIGIGYQAGRNTIGSNGVYLGYQAGYNETTGQKLYIENSDADANNALIYGEFDNDILRTNSEFQIGNPSSTGYAFPTTDGTSGQVLTTDGSGQLFFTPNSASNAWSLTGNSGIDISTEFLGSTDLSDFSIRTNDIERIRIDANGEIGIGTAFPDSDYNISSFSNSNNSTIKIGNKSGSNATMQITTNAAGATALSISQITGNNVLNISAFNARLNSFGLSTTIGRRISGFGERSAVYNSIGGNSTSDDVIGFHNSIYIQSADIIRGVYNFIPSDSSGEIKGIENRIIGSTGLGNIYGTHNFFGTNLGARIYGTFTDILSDNNFEKYGDFVRISSSAGGQHYGYYAEVLKPGGFSGYFLGNVAIGTATTNTYTLPPSRGTNGQVMVSDGLGNLSFQTLSGTTDDQNISGSGLFGTDLTIGIENGTSQTIDLSSLQDGIGTDDQTIDTFNFDDTTNTLILEIENDGLGPQSVDLSTLSPTKAKAHITLSADQSTTGSGVAKVNFDTEEFDIGNNFDTLNDRFVVPEDGVYRVNAQITINSSTATGIFDIRIRVNGTQQRRATFNHTGTGNIVRQISSLLQLTAGQTIDIAFGRATGVTIASNSVLSYFDIEQL